VLQLFEGSADSMEIPVSHQTIWPLQLPVVLRQRYCLMPTIKKPKINLWKIPNLKKKSILALAEMIWGCNVLTQARNIRTCSRAVLKSENLIVATSWNSKIHPTALDQVGLHPAPFLIHRTQPARGHFMTKIPACSILHHNFEEVLFNYRHL